MYLPPIKDCTQKYLRSIMRGDKLYVKWSDISVIKVPQYKGLRVEDIIKFASRSVNTKPYLPEYDYTKVPNREWIWNIVNSHIPNDFQKYIKLKEDERREELLMSSNLAIKVKPEILGIFKSSQAVSIVKGKSHFLTRDPKSTKDKLELKLPKEEKEVMKRSEEFEREIEHLKDKLIKLEDIERENYENMEKLSKLYEAGIINEEGNYINDKME